MENTRQSKSIFTVVASVFMTLIVALSFVGCGSNKLTKEEYIEALTAVKTTIEAQYSTPAVSTPLLGGLVDAEESELLPWDEVDSTGVGMATGNTMMLATLNSLISLNSIEIYESGEMIKGNATISNGSSTADFGIQMTLKYENGVLKGESVVMSEETTYNTYSVNYIAFEVDYDFKNEKMNSYEYCVAICASQTADSLTDVNFTSYFLTYDATNGLRAVNVEGDEYTSARHVALKADLIDFYGDDFVQVEDAANNFAASFQAAWDITMDSFN
ncbi:MAG: hypothetical protein IJ301_00920 [Clostridia bacterium]|nr:hypothetical protein [Clostridia bacterium]